MDPLVSDPFISVIVPIYNVEKHVRKCLDSLKNQIMKQIEVICVDDGSTDNSGIIADEYENAVSWPRFRVIHTDNRGLSAARNRGIDESQADWLMFVDSDDWVENGFCRIPYNAANEKKADMVIFGRYLTNEEGKDKRKSKNRKGVVNEFVAQEYGGATVWNKLYKKELFENFRYPLGRVFEDVAVTHKIIHEANRIVMIKDCLYHHVYRKDSISNSDKNIYLHDKQISTRERLIDFISYSEKDESLRKSCYSVAIGYLACTEPCSDELYIKAKEIVNSIHGIPKGIGYKKTIALIMWRIDERAFYFLSKITGRIEKRELFY